MSAARSTIPQKNPPERDIAAHLDSTRRDAIRLAEAIHFEGLPTPPPRSVPEYLSRGRRAHLVGIFPGLGSRSAYRDLGRFLLDSGIGEVLTVYHDAARALGSPGEPERLLTDTVNLPDGRLERQGFIGATMLVHSLALEAYLRTLAKRGGTALDFQAYTGESFGILTAAVASRSLSVADGVAIARAFTPLSLVAAEGTSSGEPMAEEMASYLPPSVVGEPQVPEPFHVIGVKGMPEELAAALETLARSFPKQDVEVHKHYSPRQTNVYVRGGVKDDFDELLKGFGGIAVEELKEPTTFLAHSERMHAVRSGLERFMEANGIGFDEPRTPVIANHRSGLLTTAGEVREGVLAMTDRIMASQATMETLDGLHPDMAVELGPGGKSMLLSADNNVRTPTIAYTGSTEETLLLFRAIGDVCGFKRELERLRPAGEQLEERHLDLLRGLFRSISETEFCERYALHALRRIATREMLRSDRNGSEAYYRMLEAFQHTWAHRRLIDADKGELVLQARQKKRLVGRASQLGRNYVELRTVDTDGVESDRCLRDAGGPEVLVMHFDRMPGLDVETLRRRVRRLVEQQSLARMVRERLLENLDGAFANPEEAADRITYHFCVYHMMRLYRPALTAQIDCYLQGGDRLGWLSALAVSGAAAPGDLLEIYGLCMESAVEPSALENAFDRLAVRLRDADVPVIGPDGTPLYSRRDIATATRAVLFDGTLEEGREPAPLLGESWSIGFGSAVPPVADADGRSASTVTVHSPAEVWKRGVNPELDAFEDAAILGLTVEKELVLEHARARRVLSATVNAYVESGERIVGFGKGGSESMTIFLVKDGAEATVVRKILSEALVTADWSADGEGVMLPPFAKAGRQADFLRHLPAPVKRYFPEVQEVWERSIPVPGRQEGERAAHEEVIYEMSYVPGDEVSRYIERHSPPPPVVAKIYQEIYRVLYREVHSVGRVPAPGGTLEESYFKKIEDRLELSRRTAPHTFGPDLLEPDTILINGVAHRNAMSLVRWFRDHPEHHAVLEPRFHSLVMGDTNTENIKLTDTGPLQAAQKLIEEGAPRRDIDAALAAVTAETLGIRFLDPRAIGYRTSGRETVDDPMYDNKPWHNSLGHYDEIHFEHFRMEVDTGGGRPPRVDIEFVEDNPFQRAYRVRDVVERDGRVDLERPRGIEDHFAPVMTEVFALDDPNSAYLAEDPHWLVRFVFMMGTHFTAMPPFHFQAELDGSLTDTYQVQRRPVAIYCEGVKWLNWAVDMLEGKRTSFLGLALPERS